MPKSVLYYLLLANVFGFISCSGELGDTKHAEQQPKRKTRIESCLTIQPISLSHNKGVNLAHDDYLWGKDTLLVYFFDGDLASQKDVLASANKWSEYGNIHFRHTRVRSISDIRVTFRGKGFYSFVGTEARNIDKNAHTMCLDSLDFEFDQDVFDSFVLHEFGHAIGFIHEHQRALADIPWDSVAVFAHYDSIKWGKQKVRDEVFQKYTEGRNGSVFDKNSIMIYWVPNYLTIGDYEIPWNFELSELDKQTVKEFYK